MTTKKAIIPVAGLGTRVLPASKAIPKEMFPILDKPVIQYLVEEAVNSGIEDIIMVISEGKENIQDHFGEAKKLEDMLSKRGKHNELELIRGLSNLANIYYTYQHEPLGDGHAILSAETFLDDEPTAVLFGDDLIKHETPALKQLMEIYEKTQSPIIAVTTIKPEESSSYGVIKAESSQNGTHKIKSMVEKPSPENAPSNLGIIGKYIITPQVIKNLKSAESSYGTEIRLIDGFIKMLEKNQGDIYGHEVEGKRFDTGHILGLLQANIGYGLEHPKFKKPLRDYLEKVLQDK